MDAGTSSRHARLVAAFHLARPVNCAMSASAVLLGAWTVTPHVPAAVLFCGLASAGVITAGGNTLNDHHDAEIDRVNHPGRPIPSGQIARVTAGYLAGTELAVGVVIGFLISLACGLIALLAVVLLVGYEAAGLKESGLPGNLTISALTALLFIMGGVAAADGLQPCSLAVLAFIATLGREIVKDMADVAGDLTRQTWPMRVGLERARMTAAVLLALAVVLSPLPYLFGALHVWYLPIIVVADMAFVWTIVVLFRSPEHASGTSKLAMVTVLAAMLIGLLP